MAQPRSPATLSPSIDAHVCDTLLSRPLYPKLAPIGPRMQRRHTHAAGSSLPALGDGVHNTA